MAQPNEVTIGSSADRSLKELLSELGHNSSHLIRQEIALAKVELSDKASRLAKGSATIGIGAMIAYAGILAVAGAIVLLLIRVGVAPWVAAALVGLVFIVTGYSTIANGRARMTPGRPVLERTKETAQETVQWAKEQLQ
jgi:hypothetical protein